MQKLTVPKYYGSTATFSESNWTLLAPTSIVSVLTVPSVCGSGVFAMCSRRKRSTGSAVAQRNPKKPTSVRFDSKRCSLGVVRFRGVFWSLHVRPCSVDVQISASNRTHRPRWENRVAKESTCSAELVISGALLRKFFVASRRQKSQCFDSVFFHFSGKPTPHSHSRTSSHDPHPLI